MHYQTISELAPRIESGEISPVDLTEAQLKRIKYLDPKLQSYATVTEDLAIEQAERAKNEIANGLYRGKLHGIPIAVKDLCNTAGIRTMCGSAVFANNVPKHNATVVNKLNEAGSVLLGKLNMTEGAMGGYHPDFQIPENPWRATYWSGASSSGSGSATAAGLAYGTLGSDTGGSIRHPAAVCGTVGLKPTWGRVSRYGVMDLAPSLDHVGPLTRSAKDAGIMLEAISGHDTKDSTSLPQHVPDMLSNVGKNLQGMKIGWDQEYATTGVEPSFARAVLHAATVMESLGAELVHVKMPDGMRDAMAAWPVICASEAFTAHRDTFPSRASEYGPFFRQWLENGASYSSSDYADAHRLRIEFIGALRLSMRNVDVLLGPSTAKTAYPVNHDVLYGPIPADRNPWDSRFTVPFDFSGLPTISLPSGLDDSGMPTSIQFAGHHLAEPLLIGIGTAFERVTEFHKLHPTI